MDNFQYSVIRQIHDILYTQKDKQYLLKTDQGVIHMLNNQINQKTNQLVVASSENIIDLMKQEIAQEFGITLGAETSARDNGRIGGEMTKRLVEMAKEQLKNQNLH
jgi:Small, acid-soluble spore proteins, alpha/beta type